MKTNKGFTLIELLVVVLIIGILAAIAVPQYQKAVGKSRLATIKNLVQSIANAEENYYLANNDYTDNFNDLDVSIPNNASCYLTKYAISCSVNINNKSILYYHYYDFSFAPRLIRCLCHSTDTQDLCNQVCQSDFGQTAQQSVCNDSYCAYLKYK